MTFIDAGNSFGEACNGQWTSIIIIEELRQAQILIQENFVFVHASCLLFFGLFWSVNNSN